MFLLKRDILRFWAKMAVFSSKKNEEMSVFSIPMSVLSKRTNHTFHPNYTTVTQIFSP